MLVFYRIYLFWDIGTSGDLYDVAETLVISRMVQDNGITGIVYMLL